MLKKTCVKLITTFIIFIVIVQGSAICYAKNNESIYEKAGSTRLNSKSLENFTDSFLNKNMEENFVPGAVVTVVENGEVIFNKGYGYEDVSTKLPMDPDKSLIHIGSVGKLFTQTATMQLYEKGKLKLDEDISTYLGKITVKSPFKNKVTIENLLTHTDGFEESSFVGSASKSYTGKTPYKEFIINNIPKVLESPGSVMHYTNIGTDILGLIVQNISGLSYSEYILKNIFVPLEMKSSLVSPTAMPRGYVFQNGKFEKCPTIFFNSPGSGDVVTTGADISKFMLAHLGRASNSNILKTETLNNMHQQHFTNNSKMFGMAYGFYEAQQNGLRIIKHDGAAVQGFMSTLFLVPEKDVGVFISTNSLGSDEKVNSITFDYQTDFIDNFYPQIKDDELKPTEYKEYYKKLVGTYRNYDNVSKIRLSKLAALFPPGLDSYIEINPEKNLVLKGYDITGKQIETKLCEIEPYLFKRMDNGTYVSFKVSSKGDVEYLFRDEPFDSYESISFFETMTFNLMLLGVCMVFFSLTTILFVVLLFKRFKKRKKLEFSNTNINLLLAGVVSFLNLTGMAGVLISSVVYYWDFQFAMPKVMYVFLSELILAIFITMILAIRVTLIIRKTEVALWHKVIVSGVIVASTIFIAFAKQWNLIGFKW